MTDIVERLREQADSMLSVFTRRDRAAAAALDREAADEIERLRKLVQSLLVANTEYQDDIDRLRAALLKIDGLNDNPAVYNSDINTVLRESTVESKP